MRGGGDGCQSKVPRKILLDTFNHARYLIGMVCKNTSKAKEVRTEVIHVRVTKTQWRQLKIIAEANNRTLVNQVFAIIAGALNGRIGRGR